MPGVRGKRIRQWCTRQWKGREYDYDKLFNESRYYRFSGWTARVRKASGAFRAPLSPGCSSRVSYINDDEDDDDDVTREATRRIESIGLGRLNREEENPFFDIASGRSQSSPERTARRGKLHVLRNSALSGFLAFCDLT